MNTLDQLARSLRRSARLSLVVMAFLAVVAAPSRVQAWASAPTLIAPSGGTPTMLPTYKWTVSEGAVSYLLQLYDASDNRIFQQVYGSEVCSGSVCSVPAELALDTGSSYSWYVKGRDAGNQGDWSEATTFWIETLAPPVLGNPSTAVRVAHPPFSWQPVPGATGYQLEVLNGSGASVLWEPAVPGSVCASGTCVFTSATALTVGSYAWRLRGTVLGGIGDWGGPRAFSVEGLPEPTLLAPWTVSSQQPTYSWSMVPEAEAYALMVNAVSPDGTNTAVVREVYAAASVCSGGTCSATPGVTLAGGLHKWYVHSYNSVGYGPIDTVASFVAANWASTTRCPGASAAADFNGDGRADELCVNGDVTNVALGAGSGFGPASAWLDSALVAPLVADFNGDGKADVAHYDRDARSFSVALSSGSSFGGFSSWGNAYAGWSDGEVYGCGFHAMTGVGNFDGNGFPDVWCRGVLDGKIFVGKNTGSAFSFSIFADYVCGTSGDRVGPADFDGDGRDDFYCIDGSGGTYARLSNGQAFEEYSFQGLDRGYCERGEITLTDMNGDGRTDVTCQTNGLVALSTGTAFSITASGGQWCNYYDRLPDGSEGPLHSQMQPMDTDGDGLPELVCTYAGSSGRDVHVRKWNGTSLGPAQLWASDFCVPSAGASSSIVGGDFDGDGKGELVCNNSSVLPAGTPGVIVDLMTSARTSLGGWTSVAYAPSSLFPSDNNPGVRQVVTAITTNDGRGGTSTTRYSYSGARVDRQEPMDLGFRDVWTTLPCLSGETNCPITRMQFSQELRSLGAPVFVRKRDSAGFVLQDTWSFFYPQTGPALPRKAFVQEIRTTDYGPQGGSKTTSVTYQYDAYANAIQVFSHGDVENPNDELRTDLTPRAPDLARYIVDRVRLAEEREQRGEGWVLLSSVETTHNAAGDPELVKTAVLPGSTFVQRSMTYDSSTGNLLTTTSELGGVTRIVAYDPDNLRPQTVTNPAGETTTAHWHPLCGDVIDTTDANNVTTTASYDPLCRPKQTNLPDGSFAIRSYLDMGNPQFQRIRTETPGKNGNDYAEAYLDGFGRTYRTRKRGPSAGKDILTERSYNERGSVATETAPFYEGEDPDATEYGYDVFDRLTKTTAPDGKETTHEYGLWKETTTDPKGREVTVERTVTSSTELKTVEGEEVRTKRTLDLLGRLRELRDNESNLWSWSYDSLGRTLRQVDPDAGSWTWAYNDAARTQTQTDAKSQQVTTAQDTLGRVAWKSSAVGSTTFRYGEGREGYKNVGRLTSVLSPGTSLEVDYDALGRLARQKRTIDEAGGSGTPAQSFTMSYAYDTAGRVRQTTYPDGTVAGPMGYDEAGRFVSIPGGLLNVTYDASGRPLVQTNANGTVTTRTYIPKRGVLDTLVTTHPTTGTIQNLNYDYDPDVPLVSQIQSPVAGEGWQYGYDTGDRLTSATNLSNPADTQILTYDALDRIKTSSRIGIYEYPAAGQARPHAPNKVALVTYTYDANGNLLSGGGLAPVWDAENRITSIGTTLFSYDTAGERVKKVSPSGVSLYPFGDDYEVTNGVVTKYFSVDSLSVIAKQVTGGADPGIFWLHADRLGSLQAVTSGQSPTRAAGTVVFRRTYRPYGETLGQGGAHTESRGWIDQRNDGETGLTYLHARYYDSKKGVFLSADPSNPTGSGVGLNRYAYGMGDPINTSDRSGLQTVIKPEDVRPPTPRDLIFDPLGGTAYVWENMNITPSEWLGPVFSGGDALAHWSVGSGAGNDRRSGGGGGGGGGTGDGNQTKKDCKPEEKDCPKPDTPTEIDPMYCSQDVISKMITAFQMTGNGTSSFEASLFIKKRPDGSYFATNPVSSREYMKNTARWEPGAVGFGHVHPNAGAPWPTPGQDTQYANRAVVFTFGTHGLWEFRQGYTSSIEVRRGIDWSKKCKTH